MQVIVRPYLFLRTALAEKEIALEAAENATVLDLLNILRTEKGLADQIETKSGDLMLFDGDQPVGMTILVDGCNIRQMQGLATPLREGSVVSLFPPAAGG